MNIGPRDQPSLSLSILISLCLSESATSLAKSPYEIVWERQVGTPGHDLSHAVAADALGNLFLAWTFDKPPSSEQSVGYDTAISKYDLDGNLEWTRTYDSAISDLGYDITTDNLGNAYLAGVTVVASNGDVNAAHANGFLKKIDADGNSLWERQFGTDGNDEVDSVFANGQGEVFVAGITNGSLGTPNAGGIDAFVSKFDDSGHQVWTRQFGTNVADSGWAVSADKLGNVFVSGTTFGLIGSEAFGSADTFTIKLDADGNTLWKRQWGTNTYDQSYAVQADSQGGAYIAGYGDGAFVARYDADGNQLWVSYLKSGLDDLASSVVVDDIGKVYVSGWTRGTLGDESLGGIDSFVSRFTPDGVLEWLTQFGSDADDGASGLSVDLDRDVYVSGLTWGSLAGPHLGGGGDAFLVKLSTPKVPEPSSLALLLLTVGCHACFQRKSEIKW